MRSELRLLSIVIPARNEEACVSSTVENLHLELELNRVPHEIIVVDDGSTDRTWPMLQELALKHGSLRPVRNDGDHGFGQAVSAGICAATGDAVVIMMADESDDCRDVVRYWGLLNQGWECVFGSRFIENGCAIEYPWLKLGVNRMVNFTIRKLFGITLNDTTNGFKAYRRTTLEGCRPFLSSKFSLSVELPLKAMVRGYRSTIIPITWRNRRSGKSRRSMREKGSGYFYILAYIWLEKHFNRAGSVKTQGAGQ